MKPWSTSRVFACALAICTITQTAEAQGFIDKLKKAAKGKEYTVRGRLRVQDGRWLTCFDGIKTGYLGAADMARPGDAKVDPATGQMKVTTGAIPTIIMTRNGVVAQNNCDSLTELGLLLPPEPASKSDTGYRDEYGCTKAEWTKDEVIARRHEIMDCQADSISERAWRRSQARNGGSSVAAGGGGAKADATTDTAALAAKFRAIPTTPATSAAPTASTQALAADGAKVCGLKPAYMLKLKDEAVAFVRYDEAKGLIVLSELAGGERRTVSVDGNAFAQRVTFNAQAIGQSGDTCGRAFWNAEAYKAATAAMSGK